MRTGANLLYFLLGGCIISLYWFILAILAAVTIVGLPWARGCLEIGKLTLHPFGRDVVSIRELDAKVKPLSGVFALLFNLVWLPIGLTLAVAHLIHGCLMFVTIIGIPLGIQDFKLAGISLAPVGKRVVLKELANEARQANAKSKLAAYRR